MEKRPLISVVMPCYNCESYAAEAIESILEQSFRDYELIIIDDHSTDRSVAIIGRYMNDKVRLIRHTTNMGISRTLNDGIRASTGGFIARMDADDISDRFRLEEQLNTMLGDNEIAVLGTGVKVVDQDGNFIYYHVNPTEDLEIRKALASTLPIWPGSQMWRKNKLFEAGLFDENIPGSEDLELTLRLCLVGKAKNIKSPLYIYRRNFSGESNVALNSQLARVMLVYKAFVLKVKNDREGLKKVYDAASAHYKSTRFRKNAQVPIKNKYYYYVNIALASLIYNNRKGAKTYLDKARELEPRALGNIILSALLTLSPSAVNLLFKINRYAKKYFYILFVGDVSKYLNSKNILTLLHKQKRSNTFL